MKGEGMKIILHENIIELGKLEYGELFEYNGVIYLKTGIRYSEDVFYSINLEDGKSETLPTDLIVNKVDGELRITRGN